VIPIVALMNGGGEESVDIAIGAIIGAPFLLGTLAMLLVVGSAHLFKARREQGTDIVGDERSVRRDLTWFLSLMPVAIVLGAIGAPDPVRYAAAALLVIAYGVYVRRTVKKGGDAGDAEELEPLYFDTSRDDPPSTFQMVAQFVVSLAAIIGGAELFVSGIEAIAESAGISALVLSLVLAPLATEMPEKANSVLWVRRGKDALALGTSPGDDLPGQHPGRARPRLHHLGARRPRAHGRGHRTARRRARALGHPAPARGARAGRGLGVAVRRVRGLRGRDRLARALGRLLGLALGRGARSGRRRAADRPAEVRPVDPRARPLRTASRSAAGNRPGPQKRAPTRRASSRRSVWPCSASACSIRCTSRENSSSVIGADTGMPGDEPPRPGPSR
jgi:hypothetical protein